MSYKIVQKLLQKVLDTRFKRVYDKVVDPVQYCIYILCICSIVYLV